MHIKNNKKAEHKKNLKKAEHEDFTTNVSMFVRSFEKVKVLFIVNVCIDLSLSGMHFRSLHFIKDDINGLRY